MKLRLINIDLSGVAHHARRVFIVACGTAYHAGMIAKYTWESVLKIPVEVDYASEFRYRSPLIGSDDLLIVISQSGETADTLAALRLGKKCGAQVLAITNVVGSSISREADSVLYTWAGPEIAVASTKAYCTQVLCLALLMLRIGYEKGIFDATTYAQHLDELKRLPQLAREILKNEGQIKDLAHRYCSLSDAYFIGRNIDYAMALEGSLKLKEISYIHSEAITAGELKHGPIALLEQGSLLIVPATQPPALFDKVASNMIESKARGAHLLAITTAGGAFNPGLRKRRVLVPSLSPWCMPIIAYHPDAAFRLLLRSRARL
jgi:glucosamine--fructose-6-phosphate aminotransferase (isomerizing)